LGNPHTYAGGLTGWDLYTSSYDRLIQLSNDSKSLIPMLATSWTFNSAETDLTIKLRQGVMFQDGSAFNADVAVANLQAAVAPGGNGLSSAIKDMTSVVAVDPNTIKLTFSAPDPDALFALASYQGMEVSMNGLANPKGLTAQPQGSGPYKLVSTSAALTFTLDYFTGYWNKSHVYPAHVVFTNNIDENARINALKTGQANVTAISPLTYQADSTDPSLQVTTKYLATPPFTLFMNNKMAPFDNPQVREAVNLAIDRNALNASQNGTCQPLTQSFSTGVVGYIPSLAPLTTDVTQAKALIQSAGATGATVKMLYIAFQPWPTFAQILQAQLNAIGLKVQLVVAPGASYRVMYAQGGYGMMLATTAMAYPDASAFLDQLAVGSGNPGTKDPALVSEVQQAEQLPVGSSQRATAMQTVNKTLNNDLLWAPLCDPINLFAATKNVIGLNTAFPNAYLSQAAPFEVLQIAK
jgi:peptide/nickel transport system substrate-binding protein